MRTWLLLLVVVLTTVGCTRKAADVPAGAPDEPSAATATAPAVDREPVDVEDVRPPEAVNSGNEPTTPTGDVGQRAPKVRPLPTLSSEAARTARKAPARVSIAVIDLRDGTVYAEAPDESYRMASIGKVPLMLAVLAAEPTPADRDRLTGLIRWSDNDAADVLWEQVGGLTTVSAVWALAVGPEAVPARDHWGAGETTAVGFAQLLAAIATGQSLDPEVAADARALLEGVGRDQAWGVTAGAPAGRTLGVKNGWAEWDGSWLIHSTGYARAADGTPAYVIVVLTQGLHDLDVGVTLIESIAQALHGALPAETLAVPLAEAVWR